MKRWRLIPLFCMAISPLGAVENYEVRFSGVDDPHILESLERNSQLVHLKERPPVTPTALRRRAEKDIPNLVKVLHSFALYNALVEIDVDQKTIPATVLVVIEPGETYPVGAVEILPNPFGICAAELNLTIGDPAFPKTILEAEDNLLFLFAKQGYPTTSIEKREVIVDQKTKSVTICFKTAPGPLISFGKLELQGLRSVQPCVIYKKLHWSKGDIYNPDLIDATLEELDSTGLFRSVTISQDKMLTPDDTLPIIIDVEEDKYRSIGGGLSYSTQRGGGFAAEWEHRNIRGLGEKFSINAEMLRESQEVSMIYSVPDFLRPDQDFVLRNEYVYEQTKGYEEKAMSLSAMIERQWNLTLRTSYGLMITQLRNLEKETGAKHNFNLIKTPFFLRLSKVDSRLDPKRGTIFYLKVAPSLEILEKPFFYMMTSATISSYFPSPAERFIFACKASFGTILGSSRNVIPPSERFYLGSESTLRGYEYFTVSPIGLGNKPIGGRSYLLFSLEERWRLDRRFGLVAFFDMGKVSEYNDLSDQIFLQSAGCGVRYFTDVGPLRLDFAFPLNRRKDIDHRLEVYFSVGQAF